MRTVLIVVLVFSLLCPVFAISCGETQPPDAEAWAVIGPDGGVVEVDDPESPAYGVRIEIPEGALEESVVVSISLVSSTPSEGGTEGDDILSNAYGTVYDIDMQGASLNLAAVIRIPLPDDRGSEYGEWVITHYSGGERQHLPTILDDETLVAETTSFSWFSTEKVDEGFIKQKDGSRKPVRFQYKQVGADEYVGLVDLDTDEEIDLEDDVDWVFLEDRDDLWWLKLTAAMITGYGIPTHYLFEIGFDDIVSRYWSHIEDVTGWNLGVYYEGCSESWEDSITLGNAFDHTNLNLSVEESRLLVQEGSGAGNFYPIIVVRPTLTSDSPSDLQDLDDTALFFLFFHEGDCVAGKKSTVSSLSDFYIEVPKIWGSKQADPLQVFAVLVGKEPGFNWFDPEKVLAIFDNGNARPLISIRAYIDGQSTLVISNSGIQWHHFAWAAPGRLYGADLPTIINGYEWYPAWPDVPDEENRQECWSSVYTGLGVQLPITEIDVDLVIIQSRWDTSVSWELDDVEGNEIHVMFDDGPPSEADWYECRLEISDT